MLKTAEVPYSYEGVDSNLRPSMEYFEGKVIPTIYAWPVRVEPRLWMRLPSHVPLEGPILGLFRVARDTKTIEVISSYWNY